MLDPLCISIPARDRVAFSERSKADTVVAGTEPGQAVLDACSKQSIDGLC